jgi:hypothetical protein
MFCRNILHASVQKRDITGPVHGFIDACDKLGIAVSRHNEDIYITSPYGTATKLCSLDRTLYNSIIRDSINFTILDRLRERVADKNGPHYRKDMPGVNPYTDIRATRVNIASPIATNGTDLPDYAGCRLTAHTRNTIIAGSNRAPDRLMAAKLADSDACEHPDCHGKRCTAEHLYWDCAEHKDTRKPYTDRITAMMDDMKLKHPTHHKDIQRDIKQPCFRNCDLGCLQRCWKRARQHVRKPQRRCHHTVRSMPKLGGAPCRRLF